MTYYTLHNPSKFYKGNLCIFGVKERNLGIKFDTGSMKNVYVLSLIKLYINIDMLKPHSGGAIGMEGR